MFTCRLFLKLWNFSRASTVYVDTDLRLIHISKFEFVILKSSHKLSKLLTFRHFISKLRLFISKFKLLFSKVLAFFQDADFYWLISWLRWYLIVLFDANIEDFYYQICRSLCQSFEYFIDFSIVCSRILTVYHILYINFSNQCASNMLTI